MASLETINNCKAIIQQLIKNGAYGYKSLFQENSYTSIYLLLTQKCNASCSYCYQPRAYKKVEGLMSKEVANDTVKFFNDLLGGRPRYQLFGGEPLLNFDVVKYIVEKYPQIYFSLTTNGILINENKYIYEWIKSQKHHLDLTISCTAQRQYYGIHDYQKKMQRCIDVLKTNGCEFHYVVDDPYDPLVFDEVRDLYERGIHVKVSSANCCPTLSDKKNLDAYYNLFKKIVDYLYFEDKPKFGISTYDRIFSSNLALHDKNKLNKNALPSTFCGTGHMYLAVNAIGDIYPCDYFATFPEMKLGSIYQGLYEKSLYFTSMDKWSEKIYTGCDTCEIPDVRLCTRAHCLAENYEFKGHPLCPTESHCNANIIEYRLFKYAIEKAKELKLDVSKARIYGARSLQ